MKEQCVGQWILVILRHLFDCKDVEVLDLCLLLHILYTWDLIIIISNDYYEPVEQGTDSKANYTCKMLKWFENGLTMFDFDPEDFKRNYQSMP